MRNEGDYYSYLACYCDDLVVVNKDSDHVFDSIREKCFTIKGTSATEYFLVGYFERVRETKTDNEILVWGSKTYVKCMMYNFKNTLGLELSNQHVEIPPEYKPELDTTDL